MARAERELSGRADDRGLVGRDEPGRLTEGSLEQCAFQPQQPLLAVEPAAVAGEAAARADTRWQGRTIGSGFRFMTVPTARAARGAPTCAARAPYVVVCPYSTRFSSSSTRRWNSGVGRRSSSRSNACRRPAKYSSSSRRTRSSAFGAAQDARAELACEPLELRVRLRVEADAAEAALADADEQRADRRVVEHVVGDVELARCGRGRAEPLVEDWWGLRSSLLLLLPQPPHACGGRLPCRLLVRAERGADLVVVEVVAVAEDDRGAFLRRQAVGERRELLEGGRCPRRPARTVSSAARVARAARRRSTRSWRSSGPTPAGARRARGVRTRAARVGTSPGRGRRRARVPLAGAGTRAPRPGAPRRTARREGIATPSVD